MDPIVEIPGATLTTEPMPLPEPEPEGRPEIHLSPREWVRQNLFPSPAASVLTIGFGLLLCYMTYRFAWFVVVSADWEIIQTNLRLFMIGSFPDDQVWRLWAALYLVAALAGLFGGAAVAQAEEQARVAGRELSRPGRWSWLRRYWPALAAVAFVLLQTRTPIPALLTVVAMAVIVVARFAGRAAPWLSRFLWLGLLVGVIAVIQLIAGPGGVGWDDWGGFHLTAFVTVAGIALAFPLGVLVALGRRSPPSVMPRRVWLIWIVCVAGYFAVLAFAAVAGALDAGLAITLGVVGGLLAASLVGAAVRVINIAYIELIRGVPLVTLLFLGHYVVPLVYPNTVDPPSPLARALVAVTLFEAAYIAETVRGGLQSIPRGQIEAAQAIGLPGWKVTRLIVLPQALRAVIPAMVGQFISLFKDTTLLQIVGFVELLGHSFNVTSQPEFLGRGLHTVTYTFAALLYWAGSYTMSRESRRLERRLGLGERR